MKLLRRWPLLAVLLVGVTSCAKKQEGQTPVFPTRGAVFFEDKPAAGAVIVLHPVTPQPAGTPLPRAKAGPDGSYVLTTYVTGDGAPAGEHAVAVTWKQATEYAEQEGPDLIPIRYGDPKSSGLKVTVEPNSKELPALRLRRAK